METRLVAALSSLSLQPVLVGWFTPHSIPIRSQLERDLQRILSLNGALN